MNRSLKLLSDRELEVIASCLNAAVEGPFFEDEEFHALFGVDRGVAREVARKWPNVDPLNSDVDLVVNNALANLIGYPHGRPKWYEQLGVSEAEVNAALIHWSTSRPVPG